jgi:hypothetical protein
MVHPHCSSLGPVSQWRFCHSRQAKRDPESSIIIDFWMPVSIGIATFVPVYRRNFCFKG